MGMQNIIILSKDSVTFDSDQDEETITVSSTSGGAITIESSDENIVEATISGNTISLVPGNSIMRGIATVTVSVAGTSTYEPAEATISVIKDYGMDIVTWADGTDAEIAAMVQAADEGKIDLADYWHVGDERVVRLSAITASGSNTYGSWNVGESHIAQDITLVLMETDRYELITPVLDKHGNTRYKCSFVVGLKNSLIEKGFISNYSSSMNYIDSWSNVNCYRRIWCNTGFAGAIPNSLISIFKKFKVATAIGHAASLVNFTEDLFSLFADREISDTYARSNLTEWDTLSQIEYYKTSANKVKNLGNDGSPSEYWTRTISTITSKFVYIDANGGNDIGSSSGANVSLYKGIAPFGCI